MVQAPVKPQTRQFTDEAFLQFLRQDESENVYELAAGWLRVMTEPGESIKVSVGSWHSGSICTSKPIGSRLRPIPRSCASWGQATGSAPI